MNRFSDWQMTLVKYIRVEIAKYFVKFYDDFATFVELFEKQCDQPKSPNVLTILKYVLTVFIFIFEASTTNVLEEILKGQTLIKG